MMVMMTIAWDSDDDYDDDNDYDEEKKTATEKATMVNDDANVSEQTADYR